MRFYCISHKPIAFAPPHGGITYISSVPIPGQDDIVVPDDAFGESLSEYNKLFVLADRLADADPDEVIYLLQYRKFLALYPTAEVSTNAAWAYVSSAEAAGSLLPKGSDLDRLGDKMLVGQGAQIGTTAFQYGLRHVPDDFALFLASLSQTRLLGPDRLQRFARLPIMLPAPALGTFPVGMFRAHMNVCREAWTHFFQHYYTKREGYQRRVGAFLLERLHSFLIIEALTADKPVIAQVGYQIVVSDSPVIAPTI